MRFENTLTVDAPVGEVFAYLARPENPPRWNHALDTTEQTSRGPIGVGSTYRQTRTIPRPAEEHFRVVEHDPPNLLTMDGDFGPFSGTATYRLTPLDDHTTRLVNTCRLTAPGALKAVAAIAGPRIKHAVAKNLDALKNILETR
ncbi:SRPBCC family protein [Streptomyces sp. CB01881]|uniref:SRPBCC family protein n=1 Tax=Streptomyces sp. CB01881 TaxID=2078691 RepID=UPI0013868F15|nr:SRPBCC family protein [Streptomyces sp. CB01881]